METKTLIIGLFIGLFMAFVYFMFINPTYNINDYSYTFNVDSNNIKAYGFNIDNNFYCVATANRTINEIGDTDTHEKCHALINADYGHFCGHKDTYKITLHKTE